jgi:hypothetical protein
LDFKVAKIANLNLGTAVILNAGAPQYEVSGAAILAQPAQVAG